MPRTIATKLYYHLLKDPRLASINTEQGRGALFENLISFFTPIRTSQVTCLRYFEDKLANDLSIIVMSAMRLKDKIRTNVPDDCEEKGLMETLLGQIRFKGSLANERVKGASQAILNTDEEFEDADLKRIVRQAGDKYEMEPTDNPISVTVKFNKDPSPFVGSPIQITFLLGMIPGMMRSFSDLRGSESMACTVVYDEDPISRSITYRSDRQVTPRINEANEMILAKFIVENVHLGKIKMGNKADFAELTITIPL